MPRLAESAGNEDSGYITQKLCRVGFIDFFGIDPFDGHIGTVGNAAVMKRLYNADISIMKLDIFSDQSHSDLHLRMLPGIDHGLPFVQIRLRAVQLQALDRQPRPDAPVP